MTFTSEERREMAENLRRFIERYEMYREEVIRLGGKL